MNLIHHGKSKTRFENRPSSAEGVLSGFLFGSSACGRRYLIYKIPHSACRSFYTGFQNGSGKVVRGVSELRNMADNLVRGVSEVGNMADNLVRGVSEVGNRVDNLVRDVSEPGKRADNIVRGVSELRNRVDNIVRGISEPGNRADSVVIGGFKQMNMPYILIINELSHNVPISIQ